MRESFQQFLADIPLWWKFGGGLVIFWGAVFFFYGRGKDWPW